MQPPIKFRLAISICLLAIVLAVTLAAEAQNTIGNPLGQGATFDTVIRNVINFANIILAPISALMILIGGFLYMTAGGDTERLKKANRTLLWAVIGIAIVLLSNGAVAIVKNLLGQK
ncbi:MAG: hypothetical protein HY474_00970 [Candidatus Sungbacteria bacterium]|uniref:TrbC/VIRB2 family protein n=1 Tax=Candidatus Sungiibacteriota bacterium TaxID=2750080 RepID=A0A932YVH5_9BACT|nr:hypothetical protein [Candidatus Sungbacteria bacterium]